MLCGELVKSLEPNVKLKGTIEFGVVRDEELWFCELLGLGLEIDDFRSLDLGEKPTT